MLDETQRVQIVRSGAEHGLICGFRLHADGTPEPVDPADALEVVADERSIVWLHFNANASARRWLAQSRVVDPAFLALIEENETRVQFTGSETRLLASVPDLAFGEQIDPSEVVGLWAYASARLLVTARNHAAQSTDRLRQAVRSRLIAESGPALLVRLLGMQADLLHAWLGRAAADLDHSEDQILIGHVTRQREELGRIRRLAMHLRRNFGPLRGALQRLTSEPAERRGGIDPAAWRALQEEIAFAIDEASGLYERAKLLQEELSSRLAEATSQNLYVLTITTIVFLPMTLLSGIFGMNVQGVPGVGEHASGVAFWWVMALIVAAGAITWLLIRLRRLM